MSGIRVYRLLSLASSLSALHLLFIDAIMCAGGLLRLLISQFVYFALFFDTELLCVSLAVLEFAL